MEQDSITLQAFTLAASDGRATPRILSFITLLNSLPLHLVTMNPDLWPPFYVITFFKQSVKIELPDFCLPPHTDNRFERLKSLVTSASFVLLLQMFLMSPSQLSFFFVLLLFLFFLSTFLSSSLSSILRKDYVKNGKLIKMH